MSKEKKAIWVPIVNQDYFPTSGVSLNELLRVGAHGPVKVSEYAARDESIGRAVRAGLVDIKDGRIYATAKLQAILEKVRKEQQSDQQKAAKRLEKANERIQKLHEKLAKATELANELKTA